VEDLVTLFVSLLASEDAYYIIGYWKHFLSGSRSICLKADLEEQSRSLLFFFIIIWVLLKLFVMQY